MEAKMASISEIIRVNNLPRVTDSIYFTKNVPTENGLFSQELFGISQYDRSSIWGYIELGDFFIHPLAANTMTRLNRKYSHLINGTKTFRFDEKEGIFIEDPNGETGIPFLYKNYDKIKWKDTDSVLQSERIECLKRPRDKIFIHQFLVIPPFYRDVNMNELSGVPSVHEVNDWYSTLIKLTSSLQNRGSMMLFGNITRAQIQMNLGKLFDYYIGDQIRGKNGVFRKFVLGKNVDYGARLVISAPRIAMVDRHDKMPVKFRYSGLPLAMCCSLAFPFVVAGVKDFFDNEFIRGGRYPYIDDDGTKKYTTLINPEVEYSEEYIKKMIKKFIKGPNTRFEPIKIPKNELGEDLYMSIEGYFGKDRSTIAWRDATWTDILYMVCTDVLKNKHVYVTRYPLEDYFGIFPNRISVLSTVNTTTAIIGDTVYNDYPVVIVNGDSGTAFIDTLQISNTRLKGLGGDYDGDQVTVRIMFTDEANDDAEKFLQSKLDFITITGENNRSTERDFVQFLYSFTKPPSGMSLTDPLRNKK
jgi:hypothetical protein